MYSIVDYSNNIEEESQFTNANDQFYNGIDSVSMNNKMNNTGQQDFYV